MNMATIDCRNFGDEFVIHYGGEYHRVNAYTFATSLIALSDAIRSANHIINPGYEIEIVIEAIGPGSFRTKIKALQKGLNNLFTIQDAKAIVLAIIAAIIYEHTFAPDTKPVIVIKDDSVIIEQGNEKIIIPKEAEKYYEAVKKSDAVNNNISRTFNALEKDNSISEFGITNKIDDKEPLMKISSDKFPIIAGDAILEDEASREITERTELQIVRAILERSKRRWEFVWRGVNISAPVSDREFYDEFFAHRITIAPGDSLDVQLRVVQKLEAETGIYTNIDYEVVKVYKHIPRMTQQKL
jgi:hypothetical protein